METSIDQRLILVRKSLDFNQTKMGAMIGLSRTAYAQYELKNANPEKLVDKLELKFDVNPTWYLTGEGEMFLSKAPKKKEPDILPGNELGERILSRRKVLKLSQAEAAALAGCERVTWARYESGKSKPTSNFLTNIARALNVEVNWLLTGDGITSAHPLTRGALVLPTYNELPAIELPMLSFRAAASFDCHKYFEDPSKYDGANYSFLKQPGFDYSKAVIIDVEGSSMEPRYPARTKLVAELVPDGQWQHIRGPIFISLKSGMFLFKRAVKNPENGIVIQSDNPPGGISDEHIIQLADINCLWRPMHICYAPVE